MITNLFKRDLTLLALNIERHESSFNLSIAFKTSDASWTAMTLGGISGDLDEDLLIHKIRTEGYGLDKKQAEFIFNINSNSTLVYEDI